MVKRFATDITQFEAVVIRGAEMPTFVWCVRKNTRSRIAIKILTEHECQYPEIVGSRFPVNIKQLNDEPKGHPDREFFKHLMVLRTVSTRDFLIDRNFLLNVKTYNQPDEFLLQPELIDSELSKGYLIGPYDSIPFSDYRINPVGIVEGKYSEKRGLLWICRRHTETIFIQI